ncbi:MAG: ABC transporter permease [Candidatus Omnitrophica bacterium]|nr:ABC transporter permease [Candidatus Omnitrophota bacterium]
MRAELFISFRYLITKRKEKFISLISVISILGVAIGVAALIVVIGVMTGFDRELREKIVGNYAHITVTGYKAIPRDEYEELSRKISLNPHVVSLSPYIQGQVLIKEGKSLFAAGLRGIDPVSEPQVTKIGDYLRQGSLEDLGKDCVIVGKELAAFLGLGIGSNLLTYSSEKKERTLKIVGVFNSGMYDYDMNLIFTRLDTAAGILGMGDEIGAIAVKLDNLYSADKVRDELARELGFDYNFKTWVEANRNFFAALKLEKLVMFIILTLIILVASFNIISTLVVLVIDKAKDIGILKALGMSARSIRGIFTLEGFYIGSLGIVLGSSVGIILCALLKKYQFIRLPQDIYYIDSLPVSIALWPDIVIIISASLLITLVSTFYPAGKAARLSPVEALRYE